MIRITLSKNRRVDALTRPSTATPDNGGAANLFWLVPGSGPEFRLVEPASDSAENLIFIGSLIFTGRKRLKLISIVLRHSGAV
jgi:hypothetical protein